ncbi:TlpA disulfide reductase family protein [Mucilaginibacter gossypii]|uniref:TlpA disulfide reductase family protein n=1 Tax=Mucilaginibacter gossypii TaxID=551996 RepID=UPI000DCD55DF|nr:MULTISPECIES: TlpA disulfide reductase family protein [Mucilaginibacter]QTE35034.1 TlpA disulfide reductase family protein [Mucilaginibacter gossypii]RAV59865.1 alkyl hydroperoxide reductase [Mucilaginibacter rubeus]
MKKLFFYIAAMLPVTALAQATDTFVINGKLGNVTTPAKVYLSYQLGANNVTDSANVVNGAFSFTGTIFNPVNATLAVNYKGLPLEKFIDGNYKYADNGSLISKTADDIDFFLEKGTIVITSKDSIDKAQITGSQLNTDNVKLQAQLKAINQKGEKLMAEARAATPEQQKSAAFRSAMQARYKALQTEQKTTLKSFIAANPDSYLSLLALTSVSGPAPDLSEVEPLYNSLSQKIKDTEAGKMMKVQLDALKVTAIGSEAPDFIQNDVNGTPVKLSSFRGKYVLLDFWASWCGPCRQENPNVVRNYARFKNKNFTVVGVSLDRPDGKSAWLAAIKSDGLEWTQLSDLKFWNNQAAALYSVTSIPQNFLIDPQGKIIAKNLRGEDLDAKLEQLFGKYN